MHSWNLDYIGRDNELSQENMQNLRVKSQQEKYEMGIGALQFWNRYSRNNSLKWHLYKDEKEIKDWLIHVYIEVKSFPKRKC